MGGKQIRIGALISGGGTNLQAIIDACVQDKIDARIVFVGTDNPDAKGLARAQKANIPTFVTNYSSIIKEYGKNPDSAILPEGFELADIMQKQFLISQDTDPGKLKAFLETRAIAERRLLDAMKPYPFDLLVLAGFMRNLTPYFIDEINDEPGRYRIMNIHPALLPAFPGTDGYGDTLRYGCKVGGCTVHFIDYGEDSGPIIGQKSFPISDTDTKESVISKGLHLEWQLYPESIQKFAEGRLSVVEKNYDLGNGKSFSRKIVVCS